MQPRRGAHISLIGSYKPHMREVAPELLANRTGGIVYVDGTDECRAEAGELEGYVGQLVEIGSLQEANIKPQKDADLTVWKSVSLRRARKWAVYRALTLCFRSKVGLGVQDVTITNLIFCKGKELGLGQVVVF